jgi:hypothetical protein
MERKKRLIKNIIIIIVFVLVFAGIAISFLFLNKSIIKNKNTSAANINETSKTVSLNSDVYPLYSGVTWSQDSYTDEYNNLVGYEISANAVNNTYNIAEVSTPFEKYYADKLTSLGWNVDNSRAAGGPGVEITAYKKGDEYIIVRFETNFKGIKIDEPVQCPCNVTFYIFSGKEKVK